MYTLTYSFEADTGMTLTPSYINEAGAVGAAVTVTASFEITGWYGFALSVSTGFQGYIGFFDGSNTLQAMFACNPQEGENLDIKVSSINEVGPGGFPYPVVVQDTNNNPIEGAQVWLSTDTLGRNIIAGTLITDSTGTVKFEIPAGTYYLWRFHSAFTFPNPKTVVVS